MTILKVCQDPVVGACFRLHPRHHHSALLCAHHELAEHGGGDGDDDGDDDEEEAMLKRELHLGRFQGDIWIADQNDEYLKVETLGWSAQRKGS